MNTVFIITGGAGRVLTAIPALEKYHKLNPNDDFKIIIPMWDYLYYGHPLLQKKVFNHMQKESFERFKDHIIKLPEPYHELDYYNQKIGLVEAFDRQINGVNNEPLNSINLYLDKYEKEKAIGFINDLKEQTGCKKVVIFQPYGSGTELVNKKPIDNTNRSLSQESYVKIAKNLSSDHSVVFFGPMQLRSPDDAFTMQYSADADLRVWMALISQCDVFLGVDSVGQHMARAFNKPGVILMGSTFEINVSYPDHFEFYRKENHLPTYVPIRLFEFDCHLANRLNNDIMEFTDSEIAEICSKVRYKPSKKTNIKGTKNKLFKFAEETNVNE